MLTNSMIGMIRRRWAAERPYAGNTTQSLRRKLACSAVAEWAKDKVRQEMRLRGEDVED